MNSIASLKGGNGAWAESASPPWKARDPTLSCSRDLWILVRASMTTPRRWIR